MTAHGTDVGRILATLHGKWVEAVDPAPRSALVTSGAAILHGDLRIPAGEPARDDSRVLGAHLTASTLATDGTLTLLLTDADGSRPLPLAVAPPWGLALPDGAGLVAARDGRVGTRPRTPGPRFATAEAMAEWTSTTPDAIEQDVLDAADDDWVTPADVVSALVERGVQEPQQVARHGVLALARLVARGDLEAGTVGEDGFVRASEDPSASIEHLAALWSALGGIGRLPGPGQIAWFSLTAAGEARLAAGAD